jgi:hypothetical protein
MDYAIGHGAKRNFEPWREAKLAEETEEERLDRLEREEAERDAMKELEAKTLDAKTEMQIADALDEIRTRNARNERAGKEGAEVTVTDRIDDEREALEKADAEAARLAFLGATGEKVKRIVEEDDGEPEPIRSKGKAPETSGILANSMMLPPTFTRTVKKKKDLGAALGIKKKPALV